MRMKGASDLVLSGAWAGPHERIRAQVALDVSGDDFSGDAFTGHKPLVCSRHCGKIKKVRGRGKKTTLMSVTGGKGPRYALSVTRRGQGSKITLRQGIVSTSSFRVRG